MEQFFLNFTNSFRRSWDAVYTACVEARCGLFVFDNFRSLPMEIIDRLKLEEIREYDDEMERWIYSYLPTFNQP